MTGKIAVGLISCAVVLSSCAGSAETEASAPPVPDSSAAIAESFMDARQERDVERALSYVDKEVVFDWGPASTYDTMALGWAWEDAFKVSHIVESCEPVDTQDGTATVVCRLMVNSEVATAAGNSPGLVCARVTIANQLITRLTVDAAEGCSYVYWPNMFAPFETWLKTAHPDNTIEAMYNDRISEEGLALWTTYTDEFLADHG